MRFARLCAAEWYFCDPASEVCDSEMVSVLQKSLQWPHRDTQQDRDLQRMHKRSHVHPWRHSLVHPWRNAEARRRRGAAASAATTTAAGRGIRLAPGLMVDTDVDLDDMGALMYLLAVGRKVLAVAADNAGWSNQYAGAVNLKRILHAAGCGDTEVAYGETPYSVLNHSFSGSRWLGIPPQHLLDGIDLSLAGNCSNQSTGGGPSEPFPWPIRPTFFYPYGAAQLIVNTVRNSATPVDILLLGPWTNLARALSLDPSILSRLKNIFVSGGSFYRVNLSNASIFESTAPGFYKRFQGPPDSGGQNLFLDAISANMVLGAVGRCRRTRGAGRPAACPAVRFMAHGAQKKLPGTPTHGVESLCGGECVGKFTRHVKAYFKTISNCSGQHISAIRYWDESAAALAVGKPFCTKWVKGRYVLNTINGPYYSGAIEDNATGVLVHHCEDANQSAFLHEFWSAFRKNDTGRFCSGGHGEARIGKSG
eukprot:CAMPEP_0179045610 /NCGR_PEP_ID=MMETSP0796-20121207/18265_1 /TAXON_ID=73915 /ORGANISM="Pyrodinium bahamense, Strain pbaha01" /LENGTH=478 /DNA_ID=CAMNT_0020742019 /DNA_START=108 /DNA_END=1544 /DNA_ORIENTATION=+